MGPYTLCRALMLGNFLFLDVYVIWLTLGRILITLIGVPMKS